MKVLEFGNYFSKVEKFNYISSRTLLEYDLIFFDVETMLLESNTTQFVSYSKRKEDLIDFINLKNTPLIFFTPIHSLFNVKYDLQTIARGLEFFAPVPQLKTEMQSGKVIEIEPNGLFTDFMLKYKELFKHESYFTTKVGNKIASTHIKNHLIGFWDENCVFLPPLVGIPTARENVFFDDLYVVLKLVRPTRQQSVLPEWTEKYFLPNENKTVNNINTIVSKIKLLSEELENENKQYKLLVQKKNLFSTSGVELEDHIKNLLEEIGFETLETESNREDLIAKFKDKVSIFEIKGVSGSAAEKHAAQLEKWSAEFFSRTGKKPKPFLIVNAYKDKPLFERKDDVFPHQMLKYSTLREHCLISTLQLLGLYYYIKENPGELDNQIEKLFSTVGVYEEFSEWDKFISYDLE